MTLPPKAETFEILTATFDEFCHEFDCFLRAKHRICSGVWDDHHQNRNGATNQSGILYSQCKVEFQKALNELTRNLAHKIVKDGEGSTKFVEVSVSGLESNEDCLEVAYTVAHSPLVKTALFASDANWGRILAAVGRARVKGISFENINISLNEVQIISSGEISDQYSEEAGSREMEKPEITIRIDLGGFKTNESVWTTDLSYEYVKINAEYRS